MELDQPVKIYTAENNLEAIMIAEMLRASGLAAFTEEDQSGVSLWMLGTLPQFHQPNVWVEAATAQKAAELIRQFEKRKWDRAHPAAGTGEIEILCEECGRTSSFPNALRGTVQDCPYCHAYVDVGELDWETGSDEPEGL
jgi:hypothetical protein